MPVDPDWIDEPVEERVEKKPEQKPEKKVEVTPAPEIDFGYPKGKFNNHVENIRGDAKVVIDRLPKPESIKVGIGKFFTSRKILQAPAKDPRVFLHEYGHSIDNRLSSTSTGFYSQFRLAKAHKKDAKKLGLWVDETAGDNYEKVREQVKAQKKVLKKFEDKWVTKRETFFVKGRRKGQRKGFEYVTKEDYQRGMSDIIDSMSQGSFRTYHNAPGHGRNYYRHGDRPATQNQMTENFANLFQLWSEETHWGETKKLFPNLTKEFEGVMQEVIDGKLG